MSNISSPKIKWTDGRLIRLSLAIFFALILLVYALQSGDILRSGKNTRLETPNMLFVPTIQSISPELDDVIIFPGESVARKLDKGGIQNWTFDGVERTLVDISILAGADAEPGFNPVIEIYAPDGNLLTKSDELGPDQPELLRGLELPSTGEYTIWVTDATFEHGGTYTMTFTPFNIKATHPQRIGVGETLRGILSPNNVHMWVFSAAEGQSVSITLLPIREWDETFRPIGELYSPDGQFVAKLDVGSADALNVMRNIPVDQTGNYTLWIMDAGYDDAGQYAVSVQAGIDKSTIRINQ